MYEEKRRYSYRPCKVVGSIIAGVFIAGLFALIIGALVMVLWNWLMPDIFGLEAITYWQGFGIALLARLLFGAGHKWHGGADHNEKYKRAHKVHMHHGPRRNWWFDDVYEQWWEAEGAKSFDEYIKREEKKEEEPKEEK